MKRLINTGSSLRTSSFLINFPFLIAFMILLSYVCSPLSALLYGPLIHGCHITSQIVSSCRAGIFIYFTMYLIRVLFLSTLPQYLYSGPKQCYQLLIPCFFLGSILTTEHGECSVTLSQLACLHFEESPLPALRIIR